MRAFILIVALLFLASVAYSADRVRGHWRDTDRDGIKDTYVNPYERSSPNRTKSDNYSTPGNYNPNTGEVTRGNMYNDRYNDNPHHKSIYDD
jgi:hypothetical protein